MHVKVNAATIQSTLKRKANWYKITSSTHAFCSMRQKVLRLITTLEPQSPKISKKKAKEDFMVFTGLIPLGGTPTGLPTCLLSKWIFPLSQAYSDWQKRLYFATRPWRKLSENQHSSRWIAKLRPPHIFTGPTGIDNDMAFNGDAQADLSDIFTLTLIL